MKAVKIIAVITCVIFLIIAVSFFFFKPWFYRLFYFPDRITGTVSVKIDGEKYDLNSKEISCQRENKNNRVRFKDSSDGTIISVRAGDYGPYYLNIRIEEINTSFECVIYQYNWWNVCDFDLDISIDSETGKVKLNSTAIVLNENGEKTQLNNSSIKNYLNEKIEYYIVSL